MELEEFCDKYCPMPFRGTDRTGGTEVDCDMEESECPFKDVDFSKVKEYRNMSNLIWEDGVPKCSCGSFKLNATFEVLKGKYKIVDLSCFECNQFLIITPEFETYVKNQKWRLSHERIPGSLHWPAAGKRRYKGYFGEIR